MYYSPEELMVFAAENELLEQLVNAAANNNKGYSYFPVTDFTIETKDGIRYLHIPGFSGSDDPEKDLIELEGNFFEDLSEEERDYLAEHPERMTALIISYNDAFSILFSLNNEPPADNIPSYARELCTDFMETCGINTRGRLKAVCREGEEIVRAMFDSPISSITLR